MTRLGHYPQRRMRRLRLAPWIRALVRQTQLHVHDLIWPVFVHEGHTPQISVPSLPGVDRLSVAALCQQAAAAHALGIQAVALFPVVPVERKSEDGSEALRPDNLACTAVRALKAAVPTLGVIADVALDPYTSHGQDGLVRDGVVVNDATVAVLQRQAQVLAAAGCDVVAPSDMMDGRIGAIRTALDTSGHQDVAVLAYAAKYASVFYGPFRAAVGSQASLAGGDKRSYQMDPANADEALHEVSLDLQEGADMVMVKPALPYLDVLSRVKRQLSCPTFAYQVSGEYAMLRAAAAAGCFAWEAALLESLVSIRRAGADAIFCYAAPQVAAWLRG